MPEFALLRTSIITTVLHLVFGIVAIFVGAITIKLVDKLVFKRIDLEEEIARGNLAAAVLAGSIWIALAMILVHAG